MTPEQPGAVTIYRMAAVAGLLILVLTPAAIAVFAAWPPPYDEPAAEWFEVFNDNVFIGLLSMDLLLMAVLLLEVPVLLALYAALWRDGKALVAIAIVVGLIGIAMHLSSITAFEMMILSDRYAEATTEAERSQLLAAGEAALATYEGTAFQLNYFVGGTVVPLLISAVMLRSAVFSRLTGWTGIVSSVVNLGLYVPAIGLLLSILAGVAFWCWYILITLKFRQLGRPGATLRGATNG